MYEITKENAELARKILKDRVKYYNCCHRDIERAGAYESASSILECMLDNDYDCLKEFDYFGEE